MKRRPQLLLQIFKGEELMEDGVESGPAKYAGLLLLVVSLPVDIVVGHCGNPTMGMAAGICFAVSIFALGMCWELRTCKWFWFTLPLLWCIHLPFLLRIHPVHEWIPAIALLPAALADLVLDVLLVRTIAKILP
jgi:hypothetical protein